MFFDRSELTVIVTPVLQEGIYFSYTSLSVVYVELIIHLRNKKKGGFLLTQKSHLYTKD